MTGRDRSAEPNRKNFTAKHMTLCQKKESESEILTFMENKTEPYFHINVCLRRERPIRTQHMQDEHLKLC